jgi:hypothetical protein
MTKISFFWNFRFLHWNLFVIWPPARKGEPMPRREFVIWCLSDILKNSINKYFAELSSALPKMVKKLSLRDYCTG